MDMSETEAKRLKDDYVGVEHLLLGIIKEGESPAARITGRRFILMRSGSTGPCSRFAAISASATTRTRRGKHQILAKYARDLTQLAREGKIDPVIGRDEEITRVVQVLSSADQE